MLDDNYDLWKRHEEEKERQLAQLPVCSQCDAPIQSDFCYQINGEVICEDCMEQFKKFTTDLM